MSARPELGELKPGQPVMVRRSANDSRRRKPEENYIPAVVIKASRVWIEIEKPGVEEWSIYRWRMRRDTQDEGTQYSGSNASFATMEQHAWDEARRWALGVLKDNGIRLDPDAPWRGREAELADLITGGTRAKLVAEIREHVNDLSMDLSTGMVGWLESVADRLE